MFVFFALFLLAAAGDFCKVEGKYVQELPNAINPRNEEASGLTFNVAKSHLFTVSDSPRNNPLIFVTRKNGTSTGTTIRITGIHNTGGYGNWEAIASGPCKSNGGWCILIGNFGQNKVEGDGASPREAHQSTRIIEVEEPTPTDLDSGTELVVQGNEYAFSFPGDEKFDTKAMVVKNRVLYVFTMNSEKNPYSRMFEVPPLNSTMTLIPRAKFRIPVSRVTDAACSPSFLILRTHVGLNFYKWDDLCGSNARASEVSQQIPYLEGKRGIQEAVEYDGATQTVYLAGKGNQTMFHMKCETLPRTELQPPFRSKCVGRSASSSSLRKEAAPLKQDDCDCQIISSENGTTVPWKFVCAVLVACLIVLFLFFIRLTTRLSSSSKACKEKKESQLDSPSSDTRSKMSTHKSHASSTPSKSSKKKHGSLIVSSRRKKNKKDSKPETCSARNLRMNTRRNARTTYKL